MFLYKTFKYDSCNKCGIKTLTGYFNVAIAGKIFYYLGILGKKKQNNFIKNAINCTLKRSELIKINMQTIKPQRK